jgi:hypothetical protein
MSLSECERFTADLQSTETLRAEVEKARAEESHEAPLARMVALAASKGYSVTLQEAREHLKARAAANGKVLSDAELDGVAGGGLRCIRPRVSGAQIFPFDFPSFTIGYYIL